MTDKLNKEIKNLVEIVKLYPDGISIEKLFHFMNELVPKRTLQYRLSALVKTGILKIKGAG